MLDRLGQREMDVFNAINAEVARASSDPAMAPATIERVRGLMVQMSGFLGKPHPSRAYKVPLAGNVTVAPAGITAIPRTPLIFPKAGRVIGIRCIVVAAVATAPFTLTSPSTENLLSHVNIAIQDANGYPFFSTGTVEAALSFAALTSTIHEGGYFPFFFRHVLANEQWSFQVSSGDPVPAAGTVVYTPEVSLLVELDENQ